MKPPSKEKAALPGGSLRKNYDANNVAQIDDGGELFADRPANVLKLQAAGVDHVYRPSSDDIIIMCPRCGAKLVLDAGRPYWMCLAETKCSVDDLSFEEVVQAVIRRAGT